LPWIPKEWKLEELKKRAAKSGGREHRNQAGDSSKVIKRLENSVDRLLLDVPCTGLGVLKRNPDAKWKLSPEFFEKSKRAAAEDTIGLHRHAQTGRPAGVLHLQVLLPSENEEQVKKFLETRDGTYGLVKEQKTYPSEG